MTMLIKKGDSGDAVRSVQRLLNQSGHTLQVDGNFGPNTLRAVFAFQRANNLSSDGIVGPKTMEALRHASRDQASRLQMLGRTAAGRRFVVFVDAGHGGLDEQGRYVTAGKRWHHEGEELHSGGDYYEGVENRLIAERFIAACALVGIQCIRLYHPVKDTPLAVRTELVRDYLKQGFVGYLHSFHSNAISSSNSAAKLESTQGFMVFNTLGGNFSDQIATQHFDHVRQETQGEWVYREQAGQDGDVDFEVNFQLLRETNLPEFDRFGAILEEWGFHTSRADTVNWITSYEGRYARVAAAVRTAQWARDQLIK